ncbi:hypothetical protein CC85DRAFT_311621 [Cutaneotrichosporon oleaginosum]|uniref:Cytokinesis regulator n=1 Tax=Cutaneotrichosporon oleaginosum TaxID=879819 RepID=A0A0J0XRG9_9TREE|nr:uncharacterized protein CC85DRAFT_311621 [Cutaneotrichosporon oleaginosum]KLT43662.1 hypothetical protein CC85DRAFT_311621 [Cutaneotrichosporon oleaginosum]TXT12672.1 hypothetical protein COLE_03082 [Cutaneotrichosporon oleaginosum]
MPIPPPGGWVAPADDWSDDPSFDFGEGGMLSTSSPASSSSRSSRPARERRLSGSPLRQMHLKDIVEDDFVIDDDAFDDAPPPTLKSRIPLPIQSTPPSTSTLLRKSSSPSSTLRARKDSSSPRSNMKTLTLNATVMGSGPKGVGTITRLGSNGKAVAGGNVKAKARAIEKAWEGDLDFDSSFDSFTSSTGSGGGGGGGGGGLQLKLKPKSLSAQLADMNALDDLPDLDDGDQDTLKASATLKAKLPPPRRKDDNATIKLYAKPPQVKAPKQEDDEFLEDDLVLPLNLTNLTLATQSQPVRKLRPRTSMASTATTATDWDAPTTPSTTGRKSIAGAFSWGDESPNRGRHSETSATSVSDDPERDFSGDKDNMDEEDYEDGIVLPDPSFFTSRNANTLNQILDRKRKQQYAPPPPPPLPQRGDDSFEDGIVFDNPRAELTHRRLEKNRRNRTIPTPFLLGAERKKAETSKLGYPFPFPPPPTPPSAPPPQRARSPGGSLRSNSGKTRPESPFFRSGTRSRRTSENSMQPPPVPALPSRPTASNPVAPSTSHRLRSQKSHHNLAPSPSPTLARKQSLASMQDAMASGHRPSDLPPPLPIMPGEKPGSRLTMPTSSSLAKMRPPVNSTFNRSKTRTMEMPRRTKQWGDGTELDGLEDLRVDDDPAKSPRSTGSKSPYSTLRGRKSFDRAMAKQPPTPTTATFKADDKEKDKKKRRQRKPALNLIRNLGATDKPKTVGEMTWNPRTSRWEGNEGVLRDFDAVASSARPALISHFTGSSVASSPHTSAPQARIFGDMKFDPERMCWVSLLPPDEVEPDPFADMADDEESVSSAGGGSGGGTIRQLPHKLVSIGFNSRFVSDTSIGTGLTASTAATGHTGMSTLTSASWEERAPMRTEMPELWAECREAEERHRREMRGWVLRPVQSQSDMRDRERREEKRLWEVRNLALRS